MLGYIRVNECPAGLEPPAGARYRRKAIVKIRRNRPLWILMFANKIHLEIYLPDILLSDRSTCPFHYSK